MSVLVADCPRCGAQKISFDLKSYTPTRFDWGWQTSYEAFCVCRKCHRSTVFVLTERGIDESKAIKTTGLDKVTTAANDYINVKDYISAKDSDPLPSPEYIPEKIEKVFAEGSRCLAIGCYNAAGAMYRLCIDIATKDMLPIEDVDGINSKIRRNLGLRLPWLFSTGRLPIALEDLSHCIKEDGNDGAHDGTLGVADAEDISEFTFALLERLFTEPEKLKLAKARREARRGTA